MMSSLMISLTPSPSSISLPSSSPQHQQIRKECHSNNKLDNLSIIEVALSILDDGIDSGSDSDSEDNDNDNDSDSVYDDADGDDDAEEEEEEEEDDDYDDDDNAKKQKEIFKYIYFICLMFDVLSLF